MEKYLHTFNLIPGMTYQILQKLSKFFGNWEQAWRGINLKLLTHLGFSSLMIQKILDARKRLDVQQEFEKLLKYNVVIFSKENPEFPFLLKEIPNPPFLLYRKGAPLSHFKKCIAMVGTRLASIYGEKTAFQLASQITLAGGTVVSGLAFGIDAQAHLAAVKSQKTTVAVLASGVMNITPAAHFSLARDILKFGGTLVSEYALHDISFKHRYLERNRLISGLSEATIIIEAGFRSGALITAAHALEQNRTIYALPGDITRPQAQGCLRLIAEGAHPIISREETLTDLGFQPMSQKLPLFTSQEHLIFTQLQKSPCSTEQLLKMTDISVSELQVLITAMELKGIIHRNHSLLWEI